MRKAGLNNHQQTHKRPQRYAMQKPQGTGFESIARRKHGSETENDRDIEQQRVEERAAPHRRSLQS